MADIALGSVERCIKALLAINKAVKTVHQIKKECRDIGSTVASAGKLLSFIKTIGVLWPVQETFKHPAISGPLEDLAESMEEALEIIEDFEGRHRVRRLFGAGAMASELRRVHDNIVLKLNLANTAINTLHLNITLTRIVQYDVAHHPLMQPQDVRSSYSGHLTTDDARSGISSEITMVTTASKVPYDPSSRLTESNLSELEVTMQHISEENISGGGMKQKIVIKISMACNKSRSIAMFLATELDGVSSVGITGDDKDMMEVVGHGMDTIYLVSRLRRKLGHVNILQVEEVKDKEIQPMVVDTEEAQPGDKPANRRQHASNRGIWSIITKLPNFMRPHARRSTSHPSGSIGGPARPSNRSVAAVHDDHQHGHRAGLRHPGARVQSIPPRPQQTEVENLATKTVDSTLKQQQQLAPLHGTAAHLEHVRSPPQRPTTAAATGAAQEAPGIGGPARPSHRSVAAVHDDHRHGHRAGLRHPGARVQSIPPRRQQTKVANLATKMVDATLKQQQQPALLHGTAAHLEHVRSPPQRPTTATATGVAQQAPGLPSRKLGAMIHDGRAAVEAGLVLHGKQFSYLLGLLAIALALAFTVMYD